ncbi:MAG: type VI secretion system contractile sheath large subunit [Gammaproteobacteria bacterium]
MSDFDFRFSKTGQPSPPRRTQATMRMLILCDARGSNPDRPALAQRRMRTLDVDAFESLLAHYSPSCEISDTSRLTVTDLEQFSPDALFQSLPNFAALPQTLIDDGPEPQDSNTRDAEDDTLQRLLGRPAQTDKPAARASGLLDQFIKKVVEDESPARNSTSASAPDTDVLAERMRNVLHHPALQRIEATWRGLHELARGVETGDGLTINMLDVTTTELDADIRQADQSVLADRLLSNTDDGWDLIVLESTLEPGDATLIAGLGTLAHAAGGKLLCGITTPAPDDQPAALWQALRDSAVSDRIVVTAPRVLMRAPYGKQFEPPERITFEECAAVPQPEQLLWGSAALLLATCVAQSFEAGEPAANLSDQPAANDRPQFVFERDGERAAQPVTEHLLSDSQAEHLTSLWGILPLRAARHGNRLHVAALESLA